MGAWLALLFNPPRPAEGCGSHLISYFRLRVGQIRLTTRCSERILFDACTWAPLKYSVDLHVVFLHRVTVEWKNLLPPFSRSNYIGQNLKDRDGDLSKRASWIPLVLSDICAKESRLWNKETTSATTRAKLCYRRLLLVMAEGLDVVITRTSATNGNISCWGRGKDKCLGLQHRAVWSLRPVFLNRRAAARYRALASIIPGRENLSF
jgi:hypothetical protein